MGACSVRTASRSAHFPPIGRAVGAGPPRTIRAEVIIIQHKRHVDGPRGFEAHGSATGVFDSPKERKGLPVPAEPKAAPHPPRNLDSKSTTYLRLPERS